MANTETVYVNLSGDMATKDCALDLNVMKMNSQVLPLSPFLRQKGQVVNKFKKQQRKRRFQKTAPKQLEFHHIFTLHFLSFP